ncbi:hypothetical protein HMN09_00785400 [Mycena chlorophos]|uniref:Immunoreactive mannoprotein MP88 n=1 Tax=Mycena chlorophos TaxID=658473 RepID=A0A8H6SWR4_MYCCL|nr:hypothetical protein HMN09_00785400 [Mycena chlorophos]
MSPLRWVLAAGAFAVVQAQTSSSFPAGVIATGTQGVTNPPVATLGTAVNQSSMARLLSVNSIDDFCIFAPPEPNSLIADTETEEVAWCTKPRNNARLIPDGTITGVSFLKNDFYVQVFGYGDFTKLNIRHGDEGGELDPHGATGAGNPVGGNITTNIVDGLDEPLAEWMLYVDYNQFCIRACINANATYSAAEMCWHELDEMGCEFVMPGNYDFNGTFETCEADIAYPPGWYPTATNDGTTLFSTFAQYYTGAYTRDGTVVDYTVGDLVTPSNPYFTPRSSNCVTTSTIANGVGFNAAGVPTGTSAAPGSGSASSASATARSSSGSPAGPSAGSGSGGKSAGVPNARMDGQYAMIALVSVISGVVAA